MTTDLATRHLPAVIEAEESLRSIEAFRAMVQRLLTEGVDYGPPFPGSQTKSLLQPGANKITGMLGARPHYETVEQVLDFDAPLFFYVVRCSLVRIADNAIIGEGMGMCHSREDRYMYRNANRACPECGNLESIIKGKAEFGGGWLCWAKKGGCGAKWPDGAQEIEGQVVGKVLNENVATQFHTILLMANKRALVNACRIAASISDIYTQDAEDMVDNYRPEVVDAEWRDVSNEPPPEPAKPAPKPEPKKPKRSLGDAFNSFIEYVKGPLRYEEQDALIVLGMAKWPKRFSFKDLRNWTDTLAEQRESIDRALGYNEQPEPAETTAEQDLDAAGLTSVNAPEPEPEPEQEDDLPF